LFCAYLREDVGHAELISACLHRHGLPRSPDDLGLSRADFAKAVAYAPATRPGRYTILERLDMSETQIANRVEEYARAISG
jgi:glycerol-1-phosphate dehydrogenase [NAD(P)+]